MCNFFSAVLTKDEVFWGDCDSHEAIIRGENQKHKPLHADGSKGPNVLRTELRPSARTKNLEDFKSYDFFIDQDVMPSWYDKADADARTRAALKERFPKRKVDKVWNLIIPEKSKIIGKWLTSVGGYLDVRADFDAPVLTSVGAYLDVSADFDAPVLTSVGGYLYVRADFDAPVLTSVGGSLYVSADFDAPVLTSVGGYLDVRADFDAPVLTSVGGSLYVYADFDAPVLTSVGGYLDVRADFDAPVLTSVGASLSVMADFDAPVLTSVGASLYVRADFDAPVLTSVGAYLSVSAAGKLTAPNIVKVNGKRYTTKQRSRAGK